MSPAAINEHEGDTFGEHELGIWCPLSVARDAHGRGGTSFIPAIAAASKLSPRPDLLIYCTDGDGDAPKCPPQGMSVVWAIIMGVYARAKAPAHWGHTVVVSEDPRQRRAKPLPPDADD